MNNGDHIEGFSAKALKAGDEQAFGAFFQHCYNGFCFFAFRLLNDHCLAEEIVQDSFIKYWQRCSNFDHIKSIKSFLYITIRNDCLNHIQRNQVRNRHETAFALEAPDSEDMLIEEIIRAEALQQVYQAIDELPERCRAVFKLMLEQGLKSKEIARKLNISVSTVDNQKARGISLLRSQLARYLLSVLATLPVFFFIS